MRMLGYLKKPYKCNKKDTIYKIVLHKTTREVYVYFYTSLDAVISSFDGCYSGGESALEDALEDWQSEIDERGWIQIDDPMPYCQHDALLPIRVKGRDTNTPQWDKFEIYQDGEWKDYKP